MSENLMEMAQADLDAQAPDRNETVLVQIVQQQAGHTISTCTPVKYSELTNAEANGIGLLVALGTVRGIIDAVLPLARQKAENLGQSETFQGLERHLRAQIKAWGESL